MAASIKPILVGPHFKGQEIHTRSDKLTNTRFLLQYLVYLSITMFDRRQARNALINVQNTDVFCFKWCILAFIANKTHESATFTTAKQKKYSREKMTKPTTYHININNEIIVYDGIRLYFSGIEFPISNKGIIHFEKNNKDISINVNEIDADGNKIIGPTFRTKCIRPNHINILGAGPEASLARTLFGIHSALSGRRTQQMTMLLPRCGCSRPVARIHALSAQHL